MPILIFAFHIFVMQVEIHNVRGAGRKPTLSAAQRDEVRQLHAEGKSLRLNNGLFLSFLQRFLAKK